MPTEPKELVREAFEMARRSGKPDWFRMTTAVLKNRILLLTDGTFKTTTYGARTFSDFLKQVGEIIRVHASTFPPVVELVEAAAAAPAHAVDSEKIRPDLWNAVMDYSSGRTYIWDRETLIARPAKPDEGTALRLPTITPGEQKAWRAEFVRAHESKLDEQAKGRLHMWYEKGLPSVSLPVVIRLDWNRMQKVQVEERIRKWFQNQQIDPPQGFLETRQIVVMGDRRDNDDVRQLVLDCVSAMTARELLDLKIPLGALLRTQRKQEH